MKIIKDIWPWLVALFPGWWKWVGIGSVALEVISGIGSSFNSWVEQHHWVTDYVLLLAFFIAAFRLYCRQKEENQKLKDELEGLKNPKIDPEIKRVAVEGWTQLKPEEKEAVRHLLLHDTLTERQALEYLRQKGMAMNWGAVFQNIALKTNLVERVLPEHQSNEYSSGYTGPWKIHPKFTEALREIINEEQPTP